MEAVTKNGSNKLVIGLVILAVLIVCLLILFVAIFYLYQKLYIFERLIPQSGDDSEEPRPRQYRKYLDVVPVKLSQTNSSDASSSLSNKNKKFDSNRLNIGKIPTKMASTGFEVKSVSSSNPSGEPKFQTQFKEQGLTLQSNDIVDEVLCSYIDDIHKSQMDETISSSDSQKTNNETKINKIAKESKAKSLSNKIK